jgi:chromate reductase, NAD(P)H dehydrogenase (quinone)
VRLVAISGSLRKDSYNGALLEAALAELPRGVEVERWGELGRMPAYDQDLDGPSPPFAVAELRRSLASADAVLIATPEYNSSIPGALKNALDWASRPFPDNSLRGKPVAVIGASSGLFGAVWAQAELRKVLKTIGASVLDAELPVPTAYAAFCSVGRLCDAERAATLRSIVHQLIDRTAGQAAA